MTLPVIRARDSSGRWVVYHGTTEPGRRLGIYRDESGFIPARRGLVAVGPPVGVHDLPGRWAAVRRRVEALLASGPGGGPGRG